MSIAIHQEKDIIQYFRPGCYAALINNGRIILVKKMRGPFQGMYDLPGGGIDHGEDHLDSMIRELDEELGMKITPELLTLIGVFKHVVAYTKQEKIISQHIIAIVYQVIVDEKMFTDIINGVSIGSEVDGDAGERIIIQAKDIDLLPLTPICKQVLGTVFFSKK